MEKILNVAQFIFDEYRKMSGEVIDEMKLHKLLYLSQREALAITGKPLFSETMEGWRFGPVSTDVRYAYTEDGMHASTEEISFDAAYIVKNVLSEYAGIESWKLSELTHKEISWLNSRKGLRDGAPGSKVIELDDIRKDAEKVRPYDHVWDMYYDEFEDTLVEEAAES